MSEKFEDLIAAGMSDSIFGGTSTQSTGNKAETTLEDIEEISRMMNEMAVPRNPSFVFGGISVYENPFIPDNEPVISLSDNIVVSDEVREKFNKWALDLFGSKSTAIMTNDMVFIGPRAFQALKNNPNNILNIPLQT